MAEEDSSTDHHFLHVESLPLVDLRFLSQSELYSLSLCSSSRILRRFDDDAIIPKIDRSVFNESAGSRKQTFSRLRLAPRNNQISSVSAVPIQIARQNSEPIDEDSTQIIGLLQQLFGVESYGDVKHGDNNLVPVQVQFQDPLPESATVAFQSIPIDIVDVSQTKRKRGRPRKNENAGIPLQDKLRKEGGEVMTVANSNGVLVDGVASVNVEDPFGVELKRRTQGLETESSTVALQNIPTDVVAGGQRKRKRGRPRKKENARIHMEEKPKEDSGEAITIVNNNDVLVNAAALVNDPFEEELQRRTQGLQTESQLLEFMGSLDGEWASQRKRRRIVPAGYFGDFLPRGWKIMLSLKRRAGHVWIICRRYISPDGRQFVSCKEVSSYLLSCFGLQEISNLDSSHTDGSLQFLGKMAPENGVGLLPTSDMKALNISSNLLIPSASAPVDHANQATLSSSIGSGEKKNSDENVNQDLVSGTKPGGDSAACGRMFTGFNHHGSLFIDERPLKANQNDKNAVQGCSPVDGKVGNEANEKLDEVHDVASRPDAHLDARNFSNNESNGNCEFIDEINAVKCMKSGSGNFVNQDGNTRCPETISCGNPQPFVFKSSGYELPVRLVEDFGEQIDFGSGKLPPNFEEKRRAADGLEDVNIRHGNLFENDRWLTNSGNCHSETEDVLNSFKLAGSSEGFSAAHSCIELKDVSVNSVKRIGGLDIDPNVKVIKDFNDGHTHNEGVVTSFALETSSSKEQGFGCKIDSLFARSIEQNLVMPAGDEPPSAFDNNSNIAFSGTLDTLKTVEAACKNPPLDLVCCNNDAAADAYSTTSMIMGRSDGRVSSPLSSSIQNKFEGQGHGVDNADKFCLTKVAKGDQVEVCENDEALLAFGRNQIESGVDMTSSGWKNV